MYKINEILWLKSVINHFREKVSNYVSTVVDGGNTDRT